MNAPPLAFAAPRSLLRFDVVGGEILPTYLGEADHRWLRALVDEYDRFVGRPRREIERRLAEPLGVRAPRAKLAVARHVLDRLYPARARAAIPPARARALLFDAAAAGDAGGRDAVCDRVARAAGITRDDLLASLFADLPREKCLAAPPRPVGAHELALRTNLAVVGALLKRASEVRIEVEGNARALVRQARLRGLLCTVAPRPPPSGATLLTVSGPFSLFRHTLVYGRALASLVPRAAHCDRFELRADCAVGPDGEVATLVVRSGDPVFPAAETDRFDSELEERFARDFSKIAPDWEIVREPEPVALPDRSLVFPDFLVRHRRDPSRRALVEIVGFWTPGYVAQKLERLRRARFSEGTRVVLCIDAARNCSGAELPPSAAVLRYRRRIDAGAVLALVEGG